MIASTGSGFSGGQYSFVDTAIEEGKSYYYKLEEVDARGNLAQYGPVAAMTGGRDDVAAGFSLRPESELRQETDSSEQATGVTPTPTFSRQGGGSVYTIMAYADGPAKFLSGEVVNEETVQGIRSQVLDPPHLTSPQRGEEKVVVEVERRAEGAGSTSASPTSIRFRIIDAEGNDVAVASLEAEDNPPSPPFTKGGEGSVLQKRWDGDRVILTWYANKPMKGFHLLRSTAKDGQYRQITKTLIPYIGTGIEGVTGQIFRFIYTDRSVQKGKDYYYRLEAISKEDSKAASRQN